MDSTLLPPPSPLGSLPVTPNPGQRGLTERETERDTEREENAMLRAVVQQMREEMEAMMATQRAQEEQLRVSMEELKERDRESSAERERERATESERDGQIPTAVEARLTALEAVVAQRDAANQRLSSERDKVTRSLPPPPPSLSL